MRQVQRPGALRAGLSHFASVFDDTEQVKAFSAKPLPMPVLGLRGERGAGGFGFQALQRLAAQAAGGVLPRAGHWLADEGRMRWQSA